MNATVQSELGPAEAPPEGRGVDGNSPLPAACIGLRKRYGRRIAVEMNRDIVPRAEYASRPIRDGDRIEIVQFVGGG